MKFIITEHQLNFLKEQWYDPRSWFNGEKTHCSTEKIDSGNWKQLYSDLVKNKLIAKGEKLIIVWEILLTINKLQWGYWKYKVR